MTHKLSSACAEMITSYHLSPQQICFTHNWNLSRHGFVALWLFFFCVFLVCLCFVCVGFGVLVCFCFFGFRFLFCVLFSGT